MIWLALAAVLGGILGGMGMGGGTVYIPILTLLFGIEQHMAQWLNLIAFVPMAIVSLIIHAKNKLLDKQCFAKLAIPSVISAVGFAWAATTIRGSLLSIGFGAFLVLVGAVTFVVAVRKAIRNDYPKEPPRKWKKPDSGKQRKLTKIIPATSIALPDRQRSKTMANAQCSITKKVNNARENG